MIHIVIFLIWLILGLTSGFLGAFLGPGVVMLLLGANVGIAGAILHSILIFTGKLPNWFIQAICTTFLAIAISLIFIPVTRILPIAGFLLSFYFVSSVLISLVATSIVRKFF